MRKRISILAVLVTILCLTACGKADTVSSTQLTRNQNAKALAEGDMLTFLSSFMGNEDTVETLQEYTNGEIEAVVYNSAGFTVDGYGFKNAIGSFAGAAKEVGTITGVQSSEVTTNDTQIIVTLKVTGTNRNATAEIIFSNDLFLELESAALNPDYTFGEKMKTAGLNTLIGMCTVFVVLIIIICVISLLGIVPKLQEKAAAKKAEKNATVNGIDKAVDQIIAQETAPAAEEDDTELVAVIAAAIAAYEGATGTDGFVVRSVRKIKR